MTYDEIAAVLRSNHIYPNIEETVHLKGKSVTALIVECPAIILMDDKVKRIKEVLAENGAKSCKVYGLSNHMKIVITKK